MKPRHISLFVWLPLLICIIGACYSKTSSAPEGQTAFDASDAAWSSASSDTSTPDAGSADATVSNLPQATEPSDDEIVGTHRGRPITRLNQRGIEEAQHEDRKFSQFCREGMHEIQGYYCQSLVHSCQSAWMGNKSQHSDTYYCDKFVLGYAQCKDTFEVCEKAYKHCQKGEPDCEKRHDDCISSEQQKLAKHFCIDEYEYPNMPGQDPVIMTSWYDAHALCAKQGKRLCNDQEWTKACEGPTNKPYPYGWERDAKICNIDRPVRRDGNSDSRLGNGRTRQAELDRLWDGLPIGASPYCKSDYGVYDLTGNVDEVTDNVSLGGKPYKDLWKGGHWVNGARNRCRPYTEGHNEGFGYYANGFRCCADVKRAPP